MVTHPADRPGQTDEQRYRHLFEHAPICIFVIDLTVAPPNILEANRQVELVYGYPAAELVGMPAAHLVPEESVPALLALVQQAWQGQRTIAETTSRHRDGTRFPVRVIATLDPTDSKQIIVTVEDMTAEKQRRSEADAIEAERCRIAQEIHNGAAQSLAGLRFKSALWRHLAGAASPNISAALDELQSVLVDVIEDLRRAIFALHPLDLEALGFFPALVQLVDDFGDRNLLAARVEMSGPEEALPLVYELPLFRIIQEGLNNIEQHARASSVLVRLIVDEAGGVALSVGDDGCGFDPTHLGPVKHPGHFGLRLMRERILDLGGTLDICSAPGEGGELMITLPVVTNEVDHAAH